MSGQPTVIMVHGAWHGAWCFERLETALAERGIPSRSVELTSHGTDPQAVGDLWSDVELVRRTVRETDGPVVLFGHSYGGVVITEAAKGLPHLQRLIYLAAFMPDRGESMRTLTGGGNAPWLTFENGMHSVQPGWGTKLFYHDCPPEIAADAESRLVPQSLASFGQEVTTAGWRSVPASYLVCTEDQACPPVSQRRWAARVEKAVEWRTGHSPFLHRAGELADLIEQQL
ncbi:hypothetical protein SLINC_5454 [Streptomyces lincolnensis]|uniref:Uncharacterized protein n=1 Tax=Streptomyces lincolnensis TaxID=1915 RepID=A0A1B1MGE5_STRLN|nr:alpha/beta hydrolase [Streptomyces lincolnensis]ANS67678.1 hypothetical protein SLINC_5454 [Streptomyces lincolnensis]AXG54993.1 hypothetical protein SLCG_3838 [Streptomyces lincolnensis]QMV09343.1 alpha/beta fold hydrolase [Streptomyces lincolnensis]